MNNMQSDHAPLLLRCSGIGKSFRFSGGERHVLSDVSFELRKGEVLGVIGANGAGKSTLLKILAGIVKPSEGRVEQYGTTASVLDLGQNFHPELTGKENVLMNLKVNGVPAAQLQEKLAAIAAFSELGDYLNDPVKHYSSGMLLRLGFALYTHLDAEVILLDEIISVGDFNFRKKCSDKILELVRKGVSFIITSHDLDAIQYFTNRCLLLHNGRTHIGFTAPVIESYLSDKPIDAVKHETGISPVQLLKAIADPQVASLSIEEDVAIHIHFRVHVATTLGLSINLFFQQSLRLLSSSNVYYQPDAAKAYTAGDYTAVVKLPPRTLAPGSYDVDVVFHDGAATIYSSNKKALSFELTTPHKWDTFFNQTHNPWALVPDLHWQISPLQTTEPVIVKDAALQNELQEKGYTFFPPVPEAPLNALATFFQSQLHRFSADTISCVSVTHEEADVRRVCQEAIYNELKPYIEAHFKDYQLVLGTFFVKRPSAISSVGYHQDPSFCNPEEFPDLTLWIPLEDIDEGDGELVVVEGTHRQFNKLNLLTYTPDYIHIYKDGDGTVLYQKKGHPVLFYNHLLHASKPVVNKPIRLAISLKLAHKAAKLYSYYKSDKGLFAERFKQEPNFFLSQDWQPMGKPQAEKFDQLISIR